MSNTDSPRPLKLFKATVTVDGEIDEVPVWALDIEDAESIAETRYGKVDRIRPMITHWQAP